MHDLECENMKKGENRITDLPKTTLKNVGINTTDFIEFKAAAHHNATGR